MTEYQVGGPERYAHQRRGLNKLITTGGVAALLFDPGTGKTATTLDYIGLLALKAATAEARVLVVCPLAAVDTWVLQAGQFMSPQVGFWAEALGGSLLERAEALAARGGNPFKRPLTQHRVRVPEHHPRALHAQLSYAHEMRQPQVNELGAWSMQQARPTSWTQGPDGVSGPRALIVVINIDTLVSRQQYAGTSKIASDVMLDAIKRYNPDLLVVDESHKIKSPQANASRLLGRVAKFVKRRAILTGTVMPLSPMDVFAQWRFLEPYAFGDAGPDGTVSQATMASFEEKYAKKGGFMGKEIVGFKHLDHMQAVMGRNATVARKRDVLDLPPTTEVVVPVTLNPAEQKAYAEMKNQLAAQLSDGSIASADNVLVQGLRLRQITSGYIHPDAGAVRVIGTSKVDTILSIIQDNLAGETRVVVFCTFSLEIEMIAKKLSQDRRTEVMVIEGGTPTAERMRMRQRFGSQDSQRMVMVCQIKTMSLAVNELVTASHAVFGSMSQQRDDLVQARDRLDRIGQLDPVTFWYAEAPGTVDTVIHKTHDDRTSLEDSLLAHIRGRA